jgi:hypothetical protein
MVVGITGLVFACVPICAAPLCVLAIVFGLVGLSYYKAGRGMATVGLALGVCGVVLSIVITIVAFAISPSPPTTPAPSPDVTSDTLRP